MGSLLMSMYYNYPIIVKKIEEQPFDINITGLRTERSYNVNLVRDPSRRGTVI